MRRPSLSIACVLLLCVSLSVQGFAQVNTASLTGLVGDPTGAAVAGAAVTAKNRATNVDTSATTDSSGYYTFPSLPVGAKRSLPDAGRCVRIQISGLTLRLWEEPQGRGCGDG